MPISDVRKWKVHKPADEIVKTVTSKLTEKKATILEANSRRIEATIGSEAKTRFLGGIFVKGDASSEDNNAD